MTKLEECRALIDEIDTEIIELYEKRMTVIKDIVKYKLENNLPIVDASRESKMLAKNLEKIKDPSLKTYYDHVLDGFLVASKLMQRDIVEKKD